MSQSGPRARRSIVTIAAIALVVLALIYGGIAALCIAMVMRPGYSIVTMGGVRLSSEFAVAGALNFGLLCGLSIYAGSGAFGRWPRWALIGQVAGWATVGLGIYGVWTFLNAIVPGLPHVPVPIGIGLPIEIALASGAIGVFVVWAMQNLTGRRS